MGTPGRENTEFGKFDFLKKLGEGGFGEVWLADDPRRGEKVAIKFLHLTHCDQKNIDLFKREFELLSELKQVHLARVFDFGFSDENEQYFLSAEFCPGKNLLEAIEGKPVEFFEEILVQILTALECIHSQGIIHFDIKPENILVEEIEGRPNAKLVDFGVAVRLQALPQELGGTVAFLAPEVLEGSSKLDHRVDLYSLGMVCLLCLTGRLPFAPQDQEAALRWHRSGAIPASLWKGRNVPRYLQEVTEKLLAKSPAERFSNSKVALNFLNLATGGKYRLEEEELRAQIPIEGPLVERRDTALREIQARLEQVLFSEGAAELSSVYFLSGEAGIGKTRVLEEVSHAIQLKELRLLQIDCDWNLSPWAKLEKWLQMPAFSGEATTEHSEARRILEFLLGSASQTPRCLLIDDFQKADQDFRKMVFELAAQTGRMRAAGQVVPLFLLVATEEELEGSKKLQRLSADGILEYLRLILGERLPLENLAEVLHQYSGGLPLLVVEGLRFLAPHFFRGESLENLLIPAKIHSLYEENIGRLSPEEKELLWTLALLFRPVSEGEILEILGAEKPAFVALIDKLLKFNLATGNPFGDRVYRVSSQALALDLVASLEPELRQRLHGKILSGLVKRTGTQLQELAYHSAKAGDLAGAVSYYCRAGTSMEKEGKVATACDFFSKALDLMEKGSDAWQQWSVRVLRLLVLSGDYQKAQQFPEILAPYASTERDENLGWYYFKTRQLEQAKASYEAALAGIPESAVLRRVLVENALGNVELHRGQIQEAAARFRRTYDREPEIPETERPRINNNNLGLALALLGEHEAAIEFYHKRLEAAPKSFATDRLIMLNSLGYCCLQASRYPETISCLQEAMALAENSGAFTALFTTMGNLLTALLKENRYYEAIGLVGKMVSYQRRFGNRRDIAHNLLRQCSVHLTVGMGELALANILEGCQIALEVSDSVLAGWFLLMRGYWERDFGTAEAATEYFRQARAAAEQTANPELKGWANYGLGEIACDQGEFEACRSQVAAIPLSGKDHEFDTRVRVLGAKAAKEAEAAPVFSELEQECLKNHYRELLCEHYHGWAQSCLRQKNKEAALVLLEKAARIIEEIGSALPEEYRDRYRSLPSRKRVLDDLQAAKESAKGGLFGKLRSFFK